MPVRLLLLSALLAVTACGSSTADPIGIGSGVNELKRSRCAGAAGSPCVEITTKPPTGPALEQLRSQIAQHVG